MSKIRYFNNKFSKIAKRWELCTHSVPLTSDFSDLKLRDLSKSVFSNELWRNRTVKNSVTSPRASAENFPGGRATEKIPKISKKFRKIALFSLFQGGRGNGKKDRKIAKKAE